LKKIDGHCNTFFAKDELLPMAKIALPSILQQSVVSIGMMLVQSVINGFGSETLAGFSAAMRIESICVVPMVGIGNALSSYTAQNIGACKKERVIRGYHAANVMVIMYAIIICCTLEFFHGAIIELFLGSSGTADAMNTGNSYLIFMGWFFCLIGFKNAVDGLLRGAGDMKMFTIANLVNLMIRVTLAMALAPRFGIAFVWYAVPIGWFANWALSFTRYRAGTWQSEIIIRND
jgi:Na+-driven multidrug efflux pump